jgi:hypothetical protein
MWNIFKRVCHNTRTLNKKQYIQKTADLLLQLWVSTFGEAIYIRVSDRK